MKKPTNILAKSLLSGLGITGTIVAIILIALLLSSGWKIGDATIKIGPLELKLQKPINTATALFPLPLPTSIIDTPETTALLLQVVHVPIIQKVEEQEDFKAGKLFLYKDIFFIDAAGDAYLVTYELVSSTIAGIQVQNDSIQSSPSEQITGTYVIGTWDCGNMGTYTIILEARILDRAGNQSKPVEVTFKCH
jgi:hypothetical protein